jgi:hypothetical protein
MAVEVDPAPEPVMQQVPAAEDGVASTATAALAQLAAPVE